MRKIMEVLILAVACIEVCGQLQVPAAFAFEKEFVVTVRPTC
jgi:hypothetical protein